MASLVLGAVGGYFFGPVGWMVGSAIGSLLFPEKQEGPKLSDLKLQGSSYGQMIPIPYGTVRLSGQVIWQTDLIEHKHKSGGKGGPQVTTYSYSASFAVKICKGPMGGLLRMWADSTLVYDTTPTATTDNSKIPITIYLGDETALADPTMEADLGVGNVPAFRDDMVVVFTDMDLSNYGNRLPTLSFEVFTATGSIPWRVSTWTLPQGSTAAVGTDLEGGGLVIGVYTGNGSWSYTLDGYTIDGTSTGNIATAAGPNLQGANHQTFFMASNDAHLAYGRAEQLGTSGDVSGWYVDGNAIHPISAGYYAIAQACNVYVRPDRTGLWGIAGTGNGDTIVHYPMLAGVPDLTADIGLSIGQPFAGWIFAQDSITNKVYLFNLGLSSQTEAFVYDDALNLLHHWNNAALPAQLRTPTAGASLVVYNDLLCIEAVSTTTGNPAAIVYEIDGAYNLTFRGETPVANGYFADLGNGLIAVHDGVISLNPPPSAIDLASIVRDVSERAGLSSGQIDVTALTDLVDGYLITRQSDARSDITPLQSAYFFDGVERAGQMVFVKRGGDPAVVIPDDDLSAQTSGATPPPLLTYKRMQEVDLPAIVNVAYLDRNVAYQQGSQQARRQVTTSEAVADIQLPIVMSASKARSAAEVNCYGAWLERDVFTALLPRKYEALEPTDVFQARGYTMRAIRKSDVASGIVQLECVQANAALYLSAPAANITQGGGQTQPPATVATELLLLDIPLIDDADSVSNPNGAYAAMAGATGGIWPGASLYKSTDGGVSFASILIDTNADTIGESTTALGGFAGGNNFDESNTVTILLHPGAAPLASSNTLGVLNGANLALLGDEVIQFRDATLTAPLTYDLAGFLRGRRGTEWAIPGHIAGERFVMLPASAQVNNPFSELEQARDYKAVTNGSTIASAIDVPFTNNGVALRCYSPTGIGGALNAAGDLAISWQRRTRVGGAWANFVDVPLSESAEQYIVQIWDAAFANCARIIGPVSSPTATYTSADQVTDFGAQQQTIYATVGQLGALGLGIQSGAELLGAGSTVDPVLAPITPYGSGPPSPPPSGGCVGAVFTDTLTWAVGDSGIIASPSGFDPGTNWVLSLTMPGSGNFLGVLYFFEYGGAPGMKHGRLSTTNCGAALIPAVDQNQFYPNFRFALGPNPYPTQYASLAHGTTYKFSLQTDVLGATAVEMQIALN